MKVLVACERSQVVTSAFLNAGCDAYSCDILPSYGSYPDKHIIADAIEVLYSKFWDLVIAHPPCIYLSNVSAVHMHRGGHIDEERYKCMLAAREFFMRFYNYPGRICIENPVPMKLANLPEYTQIIQPYYFGDPYTKRTCLWLHKLPPLMATCLCYEYSSWVYQGYKTLGISRQTARSQFFPGIAEAMASQWKY